MPPAGPESLSARSPTRAHPRLHPLLHERLLAACAQAGGWLAFDRFMAIALYEPGLGYYARDADGRQFGALPASGSDFITAPELSPHFGQALARQVGQALEAAQSGDVLEFGAGTGALAAQLLDALSDRVSRYSIVDLSGALRQRQAQRLARFGTRVRWLDALPECIEGVVVGNEVLDAMPVQLLHWDGSAWYERGVVPSARGAGASDGTAISTAAGSSVGSAWSWADRPTPLRPPLDVDFAPGSVVEIHPQAQAFVRTLAAHLVRGAAFFIDYGFPEHEYYHPQRSGGTLMCHRGHRADGDPLADVGAKDITAHVDFTGIALAAQDAGLDVLGYTSQARFLMNCGLLDLLQGASPQALAAAHPLIAEHEMGELFKVIGFARGITLDALGFAAGDRSHTL